MNFTDVLISFLEIVAIAPIGFLCLLIFDKEHIIPRPWSFVIYTAIFCGISAAGGYIRVAFQMGVNIVILAVTFLMIAYVLITIKAGKLKILYIFFSGGAVSSSLRLFGYLLEAHLNSNKNFLDVQGWGLMLRWGLTILILILFTLIIKKVRWLMHSDHLDNLWKFLWAVPLIFDVANMMTVPHDFSIMKLGRVGQIYITIISTLALLQFVFHIMLYVIAKNITEKARINEESRILSMQASQYQSLQRHIEATSRLRHDFKHTVRTAITLASEGEYDTLMKLLTEYGEATSATESRKIFTKNSSLNAIICYYYENAIHKKITCDWQVNLPEKLGVEDIDLCTITGNLLENATHAAENEHGENRYINFKADIEENGDIYIVTTNGFSGEIKKEKDRFLTTKAHGSGIGIESIKSTVARNKGYAKFYNDQNTFYADIMLKQKQ